MKKKKRLISRCRHPLKKMEIRDKSEDSKRCEDGQDGCTVHIGVGDN